MDMKTYVVSKTKPIAIFGGGQIGLTITQKLVNAGYNIVCIIDQNPSGVKTSSIPVLTPLEAFSKYGDIFVFISLANGAFHTAVAKMLSDIGFRSLLFLPLILRSHAAKKMLRAWNCFFVGNFSVPIPNYCELWNICIDDFIHDQHQDFVTIVIHKDYAHFCRISCYPDNPYSAYYQKNELIEDLSQYSIADTVSDRVLATAPYRQGVLDMLESALFSPADFYAELAAPASLNEETGYFEIIDGFHRTKFLIDKDLSGIPLRVRKSEWAQYFKQEQAQNLMNHCKNIESLPFAVKHPAFIRFPVIRRKPDDEFIRLYNELCPQDSYFFS